MGAPNGNLRQPHRPAPEYYLSRSRRGWHLLAEVRKISAATPKPVVKDKQTIGKQHDKSDELYTHLAELVAWVLNGLDDITANLRQSVRNLDQF